MAVPFDHIAPTYDSSFTNSAIGQLQRKRVWNYIETIIPDLKGYEMLELNCGTGEDAVLFGERGFNIVATDISVEMLNITHKKAAQFSMQHRISSHYLDLESFNKTFFDKKFDLIFSNFGGLNCVSPQSLQKLLDELPAILNPGGRFVGVIMPKFCAWETLFFLSRFQFKKAFRRYASKEVLADINGMRVKTWYYKPSQIRKWTSEKFRFISARPIGFAIPPSYLEAFFTLRKHWLSRLNKLEKKICSASWLSGASDHFVIDLQLK